MLSISPPVVFVSYYDIVQSHLAIKFAVIRIFLTTSSIVSLDHVHRMMEVCMLAGLPNGIENA